MYLCVYVYVCVEGETAIGARGRGGCERGGAVRGYGSGSVTRASGAARGGGQRGEKGLRLRAIVPPLLMLAVHPAAPTVRPSRHPATPISRTLRHPLVDGPVKRDAARRQNHTPLSESVTE